MTRLQDLYSDQGQSPWLDNLQRGWLTSGELARWVERGVRGITSNPTIFQKAIANSPLYDEQFGDLVGRGSSVDDAYWDLVADDIEGALSLLRPVYDESGGVDGFVSLEVAPSLARDRDGTIAGACLVRERVRLTPSRTRAAPRWGPGPSQVAQRSSLSGRQQGSTEPKTGRRRVTLQVTNNGTRTP